MADPEHVHILKQGISCWNRWREDNSRIQPDLSKLKLDIMFPFEEKAHLGGGNFRDTNFEDADLEMVSFYDGYEYRRTNLSGANFRSARLRGTHLHLVDLTNTDFSLAEMGWTLIGDTNLRRAIGLAEVVHRFPTSIDVETIERTFRDLKLADRFPNFAKEKEIPETRQEEVKQFLRNAGIPEHLIEYYAKVEPSEDYYSCFISYSHSDKEFVDQLQRQLRAKGVRCWRDEHQLLPGDDVLDEIDRGIRLLDKVLLCCSKNSLQSWWVDKEVDKVLQKEEKHWKVYGKRMHALIPLDLDGFLFKGSESSRSSLIRSRYVADFTRWQNQPEFDHQFRRLEKALKADRLESDQLPSSRI